MQVTRQLSTQVMETVGRTGSVRDWLQRSHAEAAPAYQFSERGVCVWPIAFQGQDSLVDRIEQPVGLREEHGFQFCGGRDPVSRTDYDRGRVQILKTKLREVGGHRVQGPTTLDCVTGEKDLAGLTDRSHKEFVIERIDGAKVNDLCRDTKVFSQAIGGGDRGVKGRRQRNDR